MGTGVNWAGQVCYFLCIDSPFHLTIALFISLACLAQIQAVQRATPSSGTGFPFIFIALWCHSCKRTNQRILYWPAALFQF